MPIIKSAKKAARQTTKRTAHNAAIKKDIRLALKNFKKSPSTKTASIVQSQYDKAVKKGLISKNTAARRKSQISKTAKIAGVKITATVKIIKAPTTPKKPTAPKKPVTKSSTTKPKPAPKTASKATKAASPKTSSKRPSRPKAA